MVGCWWYMVIPALFEQHQQNQKEEEEEEEEEEEPQQQQQQQKPPPPPPPPPPPTTTTTTTTKPKTNTYITKTKHHVTKNKKQEEQKQYLIRNTATRTNPDICLVRLHSLNPTENVFSAWGAVQRRNVRFFSSQVWWTFWPFWALDGVFIAYLWNYWVVVSNISYFHPYLGKISNLTNIFQMGWNHRPARL